MNETPTSPTRLRKLRYYLTLNKNGITVIGSFNCVFIYLLIYSFVSFLKKTELKYPKRVSHSLNEKNNQDVIFMFHFLFLNFNISRVPTPDNIFYVIWNLYMYLRSLLMLETHSHFYFIIFMKNFYSSVLTFCICLYTDHSFSLSLYYYKGWTSLRINIVAT